MLGWLVGLKKILKVLRNLTWLVQESFWNPQTKTFCWRTRTKSQRCQPCKNKTRVSKNFHFNMEAHPPNPAAFARSDGALHWSLIIHSWVRLPVQRYKVMVARILLFTGCWRCAFLDSFHGRKGRLAPAFTWKREKKSTSPQNVHSKGVGLEKFLKSY